MTNDPFANIDYSFLPYRVYRCAPFSRQKQRQEKLGMHHFSTERNIDFSYCLKLEIFTVDFFLNFMH